MDPAFSFDEYLLRRQVLALTGRFRVYDPRGTLILFSEQRMFRLKEDIRLYRDESKTVELLRIQARQILDFSAAYDVVDSSVGTPVGTLRRRGWQSLVRDTWEISDPAGQLLGRIEEDELARALLRRFLLGSWLPQKYTAYWGQNPAAEFRQRFHLLRYDLELDFRTDPTRTLDRRLGLAAAVLLATIEGKQSS
jgi:uncharacterized protein YxjI